MVYGFNLYKYTVIERVYDTDLKQTASMLLFDRPGYPFRVYFKFDPEYKEIKEVYPLLLDGDVKKSIEVFKSEEPYKGTFDFNKYSYLSWDLKTEPNQVYFDSPTGLKRFAGDNLNQDMEYENVSLDELVERTDIPDNIKEFADEKNAEYIFLYWRDKKLVKFLIGITMFHPAYLILRKDIDSKLAHF